jgi:hypothetical protein
MICSCGAWQDDRGPRNLDDRLSFLPDVAQGVRACCRSVRRSTRRG